MRKLCLGLIFLFSTILLSGCVVAHHPPGDETYRHGPPPHAPAHGYRHHHGGVELVFDSGLGVYVVIGHPGIYFYNGLYLHFGPTGYWRASKHYRGPWHAKNLRHTPLKFRNKMQKRDHEYKKHDRRQKGDDRKYKERDRRQKGDSHKRKDREDRERDRRH